MTRLTDAVTKKGPGGVLVRRGWQESSQGTNAKSERKFENPLRKLKEHGGNSNFKPDNRTPLMQKREEQCLYIHCTCLRSLKALVLIRHKNATWNVLG